MKIVVTGTRGIPNIMGGVETHCEELFTRMVRQGMDVTVVRRSNYVKDDLTVWRGVNLIDLESPQKKSFEAIIHTFQAIRIAKKMEADILHIHAIGPAILVPYAKILGMKVVFTHHGADYDRTKWNRVAKTVLKLGECLGCYFADEVIVISTGIKKMIAEKYGRTRDVHLIYNGVPQPEICDYPEYFNELGLEMGKYVLCMCRFVPEKNLHHLVEAYVSLKIKGVISNEMRLVFAGDADFEDDYSLELKKIAHENGVVLTGFIKGQKLHSLLTHACCYCLPSSHEGLPISLLEAMSYRLPVVVSDIPANLEIGLHTNCYFTCGDVESLTLKLENIVSRPLRRVEYNMEKYDWNKISLQVKQVYDKLTACGVESITK